LRSGSDKWCPSCRRWLRVEAFRPNPNLRDGIDSWYRACHAQANRDWREKNPDAVAAYNAERRRDYREAHPLPTRPCVVCGKLTTKRPNALVCSAECRRLRESEQGRIFRVLA
jgi:hypothetical protein